MKKKKAGSPKKRARIKDLTPRKNPSGGSLLRTLNPAAGNTVGSSLGKDVLNP